MQEYVFTQLQPGDGALTTAVEMNANSLVEKGENKTQCELYAVWISHCCSERSPALHTSNGPKLCLAANETPREMWGYDEKLTVTIFFCFHHQDHTVEHKDTYNDLGRNERQ